MNTQQLITRLAALPAEIAEAEAVLVAATHQLRAAELGLEYEEAKILCAANSPIDGKNEAIRKAQLAQQTPMHRVGVDAARGAKTEAESALRTLQAEASCLRSIARLIARETE